MKKLFILFFVGIFLLSGCSNGSNFRNVNFGMNINEVQKSEEKQGNTNHILDDGVFGSKELIYDDILLNGEEVRLTCNFYKQIDTFKIKSSAEFFPEIYEEVQDIMRKGIPPNKKKAVEKVWTDHEREMEEFHKSVDDNPITFLDDYILISAEYYYDFLTGGGFEAIYNDMVNKYGEPSPTMEEEGMNREYIPWLLDDKSTSLHFDRDENDLTIEYF